MNNFFSKIRDKHALWYKGIVFTFAVLICTYLLPSKQNEAFKYIKIDEVWKNESLIAEIDFLIQKSNSEIESDIKQKINTYVYFNLNTNYSSEILAPLNDKPALKSSIALIIDSVFKTSYYLKDISVLKTNDSVYVISNNEAKQIPTNQISTQKDLIKLLNPFFDTKEELVAFVKQIPANLIFNEELNNQLNVTNKSVQNNNIYKTKINKGDLLIYKNDVVSPEQYNILQNYKRELGLVETQKTALTPIVGNLMACVLVLGIMMLFLAYFRKNIFSLNMHVTFIFLIIVTVVFATHVAWKYNQNYIFAVPFCLIPILIRIFFDSRTALFNFLNIILLCAFFTTDKFEFVFIQLIAGISTIFSVADIGKRSKLLASALLTFVFYSLAFTAYHLINQSAENLKHIENYYPFIISSMCVLFSFPLIYVLEKLFDFTSNYTLLELCDLNTPLLRELSQKIPGTFQHSLQVANLAEEACYKIGGNALLARTGAMYHDIGKIKNPRFFTENQVGEVSPHEDLNSEESAKIIINHVINGIEIAKEHNLPESIIDFIRTHHGTTTTRYFLSNYKKEHAGEFVNEDLFRYSGPIPFSKETAILMMADSVEASSRSLKKYDAVAIDELVDRIINHQISENQFINSDITFRDINQIKKIFKKRLMNIYHVRIEYPR